MNVAAKYVNDRVRGRSAFPRTTSSGRIRASSKLGRHPGREDCHLCTTRRHVQPVGWLRIPRDFGRGRNEPRCERHLEALGCRHRSGMIVELRSFAAMSRWAGRHTSPISLAFSNISTSMPSFRHDIAHDRPPGEHKLDLCMSSLAGGPTQTAANDQGLQRPAWILD
jgi:hypothetical protein